MATRHVCDLCQGPIEPNTLRGCIHIPKLATESTDAHDIFNMIRMMQDRSNGTHVVRGKHYTIEDWDICEQCVRMLKQMRRMHPAGRDL